MSSRKITPIFIACVISLGLIIFAVNKDRLTSYAKDMVYTADDSGTSSIQLAAEKVIENSASNTDWEKTFQKNTSTSSAQTNQKDTSNEPQTKTDEISRTLFAKYLELKQSGQLNQDSLTNLVNDAVSQVDMSGANSYSPSDIQTIPDTDVAGAKNYANTLETIREKYTEQYKQNQIIVVGKAINFDDPASIDSVNATSKLYELMAKEMAKLSVPKSLVASQVALLNDYMTSSQGLAELANLKTDPIMGLAGIQRHANAAAEESDILSGISQFFINRGIVFSPDEPGSRINTTTNS